MIDLEKQKRIGIRQAKKTIANIYRKKKDSKLTQQDRDDIARQQAIIDRWERVSTKRAWKL